MNVLVTAGNTQTPLDRVWCITTVIRNSVMEAIEAGGTKVVVRN
jgi:hypothetical protein